MTRLEKAIQDVVDAWVIEGPHPPTHRRAKGNLMSEWPTLYKAVKVLALTKTKLTKEQQDETIGEDNS